MGKTLTATSVCPKSFASAGAGAGTGCDLQPECDSACRAKHWLLVDGAPASCTQIGLFHCGYDVNEFDLVVSGPNHGPNASTIYNLSSGTVGGALEGALCGKKSIALSFGSKEPQATEVIQGACRRAVNLIENFVAAWNPEVELYNINIPMVPNVESRPMEYTKPTRAHWTKGSLFRLVQPSGQVACSAKPGFQFQWAPELTDIKKKREQSEPGEDLWALKNGIIRYVISSLAPGRANEDSVTPFKANFTVVPINT